MDTSFGANVGGGGAERMQKSECNRARPEKEKKVSASFRAHMLTHERRRESIEHGSCARKVLVSSCKQFPGYWTLGYDIVQNGHRTRSRIDHKRHVQISALIHFVEAPLRLNPTIPKSKQR